MAQLLRSHSVGRVLGVMALLVAGTSACTLDTLINNTTSLGRPTLSDGTESAVPGLRGNIQVLFVNNTPYRAIFTFGSYDPQLQSVAPQYEQFFVDPNETATDFNRGLAGNTSSSVLTFVCGRVVSIGDSGLIQQISKTEAEPDSGGSQSTDAFEPGVAFSDKPIDDPDANKATVAFAEPTVTLHGVEYQAGSLLTYTFELDPDQPGRVLTDLTVVLP